jgi:8-oxo-dGTP diphosphatase
MDVVEVVAALCFGPSGVLVQQRPAHVSQPLAWEFPGGKVDPGESAGDALRRECFEELGLAVGVGDLAFEVRHTYPEKTIRLRLYHVRLPADAVPQPLAARALAFLPPETLVVDSFCAADATIVEALREGRLRPPAA